MNSAEQRPTGSLKVQKKAPLLEKIQEADLTRVFIGLGAGVDPDGLACQMAMERIIKLINPEAIVSCFYRGDWDRAQNRTMREVLGLNPRSYDEFKEDGYTCLIMVDGNASVMPMSFRPTDPKITDGVQTSMPHFVIDHHEEDGKGALIGHDVRLIGSCSAIMWEYVMAINPSLLEGEEGAELATALTIGITTDTDGQTVPKTSRLDWEALSYCGIRADMKAYAAIKNYPKPSYQKDMELKAWNDAIPEGTVLVAPLGVIPKERKGVISSCADEFCGQGPVKTTLVAADIDGDFHFSVRTFNSSMNVDDFIKKILTKFGGGKPGAGAGVIPMPAVFKGLPVALREEMFSVLFKGIAHKTFEYCNDGVRIKKENGA